MTITELKTMLDNYPENTEVTVLGSYWSNFLGNLYVRNYDNNRLLLSLEKED